MSERSDPLDGEIILYRTSDGAMRVEITYLADTFWLSQRKIAELFAVDVRTVNEHLRNIYGSGELLESATIRKFRIVQREGNRDVAREIDFHNLDAIISVGYRVNSAQATQFRIWATQTLREFILKGFVLDDERLDAFLRFNDYEVLTNAGKVSAEVAKKLAGEQYDIFRVRQDKEFEGDFEKEIKRITGWRKRGKGEAA